MHMTSLRKVGGSVMLALPPALLDLLDLRAGVRVGLGVADGRLIVEPEPKPRYAFEALLARCDATAEVDPDDAAWTGGGAVGDELI